MDSKYLQSIPKGVWIGGSIVLAIIALIVWLAFYADTPSTSSRSTREVALACTTDMATKFHIHPNLHIVIRGEAQVIPTNIGVRPNCMNALHTHDTTGKLHVESPEKRDFTLADFFAIWGKTYSKDRILDSQADDRFVIRETVNGKEVQDYENTVVHDGDQIVISYEEKK